MKKVFLITLAIVGISVAAIAQESDNRDQFAIGLKVGANFANVYDTQGEDFNADPKFGLAAGGFMHLPLGEIVGFQPELLFSQKGFKGTGSFLGSSYSFARTSNFIDVPLLLALKPSDNFTFVVGPQFSYLISQKDEFSSGSFNTSQQEEFSNDDLRKFILAFTVGADINVDQLVFGLRAGWDVLRSHGDGESSAPRYKNVVVQGTIGFRIYE